MIGFKWKSILVGFILTSIGKNWGKKSKKNETKNAPSSTWLLKAIIISRSKKLKRKHRMFKLKLPKMRDVQVNWSQLSWGCLRVYSTELKFLCSDNQNKTVFLHFKYQYWLALKVNYHVKGLLEFMWLHGRYP